MSNVTISKAAPILPYFHLRAVSFVYLLVYEMNATPSFIHPSILAPVLLFHKTWDNNSQNDQGRNSALRLPLVKRCSEKKRRSERGRVFGDNLKCAVAATFDRSTCWTLTIFLWMLFFAMAPVIRKKGPNNGVRTRICRSRATLFRIFVWCKISRETKYFAPHAAWIWGFK